ncbi:MAG: hypothetical protein RLZZ213_307, partial [Cyanobacteriota bacterium]
MNLSAGSDQALASEQALPLP